MTVATRYPRPWSLLIGFGLGITSESDCQVGIPGEARFGATETARPPTNAKATPLSARSVETFVDSFRASPLVADLSRYVRRHHARLQDGGEATRSAGRSVRSGRTRVLPSEVLRLGTPIEQPSRPKGVSDRLLARGMSQKSLTRSDGRRRLHGWRKSSEPAHPHGIARFERAQALSIVRGKGCRLEPAIIRA